MRSTPEFLWHAEIPLATQSPLALAFLAGFDVARLWRAIILAQTQRPSTVSDHVKQAAHDRQILHEIVKSGLEHLRLYAPERMKDHRRKQRKQE